jgi:hypothetical protein
MIRCLMSGLLDRLNSLLGGVLYPEDFDGDELAELRDVNVNQAQQLRLFEQMIDDLNRIVYELEQERDNAVRSRDKACRDVLDLIGLEAKDVDLRVFDR